ncbi:MAG: beta-N-acetylhexosaminidase [Nitrospinae bacterium]|nr:beta-N-acetylhexosaminidase [Nitrospinota bacterium]
MKKTTIGQSFFIGFDGKNINSFFNEVLEEWLPGGIILFTRNIGNQSEVIDLIAQIIEKYKKNNAPLPFIGIDQEGGRVARLKPPYPQFPPAWELTQCSEKEFEENYDAIFSLLKELCCNLDFLPVLDVLTNKENQVIGDRSYGNNPETVTKYAEKVIDSTMKHNLVHCGKHFPGHGMTFADSHHELPTSEITEQELQEIHIQPYKNLIQKGKLDMIMTAHVLFNKVDKKPATFSHYIINDILRKKLGYENIVITDDLEMNAIPIYIEENNLVNEGKKELKFINESVELSFQAGNDMALICNTEAIVFEGLKSAYDKRKTLHPLLEISQQRIHRIKKKYQLME